MTAVARMSFEFGFESTALPLLSGPSANTERNKTIFPYHMRPQRAQVFHLAAFSNSFLMAIPISLRLYGFLM